MTTRLAFEEVTIRDFRNLERATFQPIPRLNVLSGDNGHGKTSVLEALYFVATSRSFRAERGNEMIRQGAEAGVVRAVVDEAGHRREQRATVTARTRSVTLDGKKPETLSLYATRTPIVVFHPGDLAMVSGPATGRRTLLDRVALYVDPSSADHRQRYTRAARSRQVALAERGVHAVDLDPIETVMAEEGALLGHARAGACRRLVDALAPLFASMAAPGLVLECEFRPGGSLDPVELRSRLAESRTRDRDRRSARVGPHRDDVELRLEGRSVRRHASQGQQRILTLALKAAELACVRAARGVDPVLLLDDVSSELDPDRTGAVYEFLRGTESQVFVTTTRPDLFTLGGISAADRADFSLRDGALFQALEGAR